MITNGVLTLLVVMSPTLATRRRREWTWWAGSKHRAQPRIETYAAPLEAKESKTSWYEVRRSSRLTADPTDWMIKAGIRHWLEKREMLCRARGSITALSAAMAPTDAAANICKIAEADATSIAAFAGIVEMCALPVVLGWNSRASRPCCSLGPPEPPLSYGLTGSP